jgi:hypothetical protein
VLVTSGTAILSAVMCWKFSGFLMTPDRFVLVSNDDVICFRHAVTTLDVTFGLRVRRMARNRRAVVTAAFQEAEKVTLCY